MNTTKLLAASLLLVTLSSCEALHQVATSNPNTPTTGATTNNGTISESTANSGIKQALSNGLNESIKILSAKDGFLGDQAVKILMPKEAQKVESALRAVGMGNLVDQFVTSMNRSAESAVKEATSVFVGSLSRMTLNDATKILLSGQQDAATNFFKTSTTAELTQRFSPIITKQMGNNKVSTYWSQLTSAYNQLPLGNKINTDLTAYITEKAIDGLFIKVADQELKIRNNIGGARNTQVLKDVFGWADKQG